MATALAAQLAKIRGQSTNSHDLKAQKKAHSQSLLFEARTAATQDFNRLYQICLEGFEDLCRLDTRFSRFTNNIFSEQSKEEDRTQLTALQNQQLDVVLEEFLSLVGSKLLLKPALKATEWLVRRFRIHEHNTTCFVLTFLPYHTSVIFPNVLSILPSTIPPMLRFLHPYIQSRASPPRHAIVYTASHNRPFFTALNTYMLRTSRMGFQHSHLITFWASIATEAVAAMLDHAHSSMRESHRQNQNDILLFLLPVINESLSFESNSELRIGSYMVLTILASKMDLNDDIVMAMMEAVTTNWSQTSHAGLICLTVLAQRRETSRLPRKVFKAIIALENLDDDLKTLKKQYRVDNLVLGVLLGVLSGLRRAQDASQLRLLGTLMEANLMDEQALGHSIRAIFSTIQASKSEVSLASDIQGSLTDLMLRLIESEPVGVSVRNILQDPAIDTNKLEMRLQHVINSGADSPNQMIEDVVMGDTSPQDLSNNFDDLTKRIPTRTAYEISFLSHSESYIFDSLAHAFALVSINEANIDRFSDLPVLRKSLAMSEPLFFSFYIRFWCGDGRANARAAAIHLVAKYIAVEPLSADVQILLPYLIYGLADPSGKVRQATAELIVTLGRVYKEKDDVSTKSDLPILGQKSIYGQGQQTKDLSWLSLDNNCTFIRNALLPEIQECVLDQSHISHLLVDNLNGSRYSNKPVTLEKGLKKSLRQSIFGFLCSHVANMPLCRVKARLLGILNQVLKVGSMSRTKMLMPMLAYYSKQSEENFRKSCEKEQVEPVQFLGQLFCIVSSDDRDGIQYLRQVIESGGCTLFPSFKSAALRRLHNLWPSIKSEAQKSMATLLLDQALGELTADSATMQEMEATETLRSLPLSTIILLSFIEQLPTIYSHLSENPPASKKRITSQGQSTNVVLDSKSTLLAVKQTTLVLELIENENAERHPELLKGLFSILSNLQQPHKQSKATLDYLLVLALDSMLSIVRKADYSSGVKIDQSAVRTDVLIDCVRSTTSGQVRNSALLLVAALATIMPDLVLHSVMPIFTFMSNNVIRQDDDFSAYVVRQTMESVIPQLVRSLNDKEGGSFGGVCELLLSFSAAFRHVPTSRRLQLFASLVDKIGPREYLHALLSILVDKYAEDQKVLQFAADLARTYDVDVRLQAVSNFLDVILDVQKPRPSSSRSLLTSSKGRNPESTTTNLIRFPPMALRDPALMSNVHKSLAKQDDQADYLRSLCTQLLEQLSRLTEHFKSNEKLNSFCMEVLDAALSLLPLPDLVNALQSLLIRTEDNIRRQVLWSFELRLNGAKADSESERTACLTFLPQLLTLTKESSDVPLKLVAINLVDKITERFGKLAVSSIIESARTVLSDACLKAAEIDVRVASLLCLATMMEVSGENFIAVLPDTFSKAIENLEFSIQETTEDEGLHNAVYTLLGAILLYIPWVITGSNLDRFLKASYESANAEMGPECDSRRLETLQLVPKQLETKECFTALHRTWPAAMAEGPLAVREYIKTLHGGIDRHSKSSIAKQSEALGGLFERIFDLRRMQLSSPTDDSYTTIEIEEVEETVNDCAIAMIYKLNDATFRPLFSRILDWTTFSESADKQARPHRQMTWYKFLFKFFDTLKSIVTSYAGFILDDSVEILNKASPEAEGSLQLWRQVLLTLQKTFEHDQDDFYQTPSHFTPISTALLSQLSKAAHIPLQPELIPAIAELAVATDSATHHKEMNTAILQHMRSVIPAVRLVAVQCERALTERLGEEWLALLPEMLPFISEALEDDDEGVEVEVQRWVKGIEGILGESLNPMLQ